MLDSLEHSFDADQVEWWNGRPGRLSSRVRMYEAGGCWTVELDQPAVEWRCPTEEAARCAG